MLGILIRQNFKIKGINNNENEHKVRQFADDGSMTKDPMDIRPKERRPKEKGPRGQKTQYTLPGH